MANYTPGLESTILKFLSNEPIECFEKLEDVDNCCHQSSNLEVIPWAYEIDSGSGIDECDPIVRRRTEKGWTIDIIFNRNDLDWVSGSTFYYWGIVNEYDPKNFIDNNLSFSFTSDGKIGWKSYRYSGYCETVSGYTESYYISTGETPTLCPDGTSNDFNVTIVFERYKEFYDCDVENEGGFNDYITGWTVTNVLDVVSGATEQITGFTETLSKRWLKEQNSRLGVLKIYLNGHPIYKIKDWLEIIPSERNSNNGIHQIWGGGTTGYGDLHEGNTKFEIKKVKYFEEPLNFVHVKHHYLTEHKNSYDIVECQPICDDDIYGLNLDLILSESGNYIIAEDNNIILF